MSRSRIKVHTFLHLPPPSPSVFPMLLHGLGVDILWNVYQISLKLAEKMVYFDIRVVYSLSYASRGKFFLRPKNLDFKQAISPEVDQIFYFLFS